MGYLLNNLFLGHRIDCCGALLMCVTSGPRISVARLMDAVSGGIFSSLSSASAEGIGRVGAQPC